MQSDLIEMEFRHKNADKFAVLGGRLLAWS
jgi:hypothetical protein